MASGREMVAQGTQYLQENGVKLAKYLIVTAGSYVVGQLLLFIFLDYMSAFWANTLSVALVIGPNYVGNRYWVWSLRSKNSIKGEIVPFWVLNIIGYVASSFAVIAAEAAGWPKWAIVAANTFAFGVVWLAKLFVFEKFLFGNRAEAERAKVDDDDLVRASR